jgi:hypothetical protein
VDLDPIGTLADSWRFDHVRPVYCAPMDQATLAATQRGEFKGEYSWRR